MVRNKLNMKSHLIRGVSSKDTWFECVYGEECASGASRGTLLSIVNADHEGRASSPTGHDVASPCMILSKTWPNACVQMEITSNAYRDKNNTCVMIIMNKKNQKLEAATVRRLHDY